MDFWLNWHGWGMLSHSNKAEMIERIAERYLDPVGMYYRIAILDDETMEVLEEGMKGPADIVFARPGLVEMLNEMALAAIFGSKYVVPCDVVAVIREVRTPEFDAYRRRASWVWMCLPFSEDFYGVTPVENMLALVNCKKGVRMTAQELIDMFDHFPVELNASIRCEDGFAARGYEDPKARKALLKAQGDKPFYVPSAAQVIEYYETNALLSEESFENLYDFLTEEHDFGLVDFDRMLMELWRRFFHGRSLKAAMQWFLKVYRPIDREELERVTGLLEDIASEMRLVRNRGNKASEFSGK